MPRRNGGDLRGQCSCPPGSQYLRRGPIRSGKHSDTIRIANTIIGDDVSIGTGRHNDVVVFDTVTVGDNVTTNTGRGADDVVLTDSMIGDWLRVRTRSGNDFVMIDGTSVGRTASIRTHGRHDLVVVENSSQFGSLRVNTGSGVDAAQVDPSTVVSGRLRQRRIDASIVSTADRDRELNDPVSGSLTLSNAADTFFRSLSTTDVPLSLALDLSSNTTIQSSDTLITNDPNFRIDVTTAPDATVDIDADGDGQFDDGSATADASGSATINVVLTHNDTNRGANTIQVRTQNDRNDELFESVNVHLSEGTVVRTESTLGFWDVELLDADAPHTVGAYLDDLSRYDNSFVHRNVGDFIIQGGGFATTNATTILNVDSFPAPPNEFSQASPPNSNERGTLSTAQNSNINSFTGQWFVNTDNNNGNGQFTNLDNVPHTVFGRVIGTGMTVIDAINNTPVFDLGGLVTNSGALTDVPLVNYTAGAVPTLANYIRINSVTEIVAPLGNENNFRLPENSPVGTSVGTVTPASATGAPLIFEFDDTTLANELKLNADDHLEGDLAAPAVLIEYLSLQCPACAAAHPDVEQLLNDNPGDVLVVRRHLPLDISTGGGFEHAFEAALAAEAAGRQGAFDAMVDELFARQADWNNSFTPAQAQAVFEDIAVNTLGLDLTQFNADMNDTALTDRINRDNTDAGTLGATSTPTFYLNGQLTTGTPTNTDIQTAAQAAATTFALNRRTGALTVVNSGDLDFETTPTFTLDVTATNGAAENISVTIDLIDAFTG